MTRARFSPEAERDLNSVSERIAADDPSTAQRVRRVILDTADFLAGHPELGLLIQNAAARHAKIRWFPVPRFRNYLLFYQPFADTIMVVRVLHASQDWTRFFPSRTPGT
jgi:plasmid stabilization system protein ParE